MVDGRGIHPGLWNLGGLGALLALEPFPDRHTVPSGKQASWSDWGGLVKPKAELAPGLFLVVAAGDLGSQGGGWPAESFKSQPSFQRPDGPLTW